MLTEKERETALGLLTRSRSVVIDAVDGVSDEQARWKPGPDRWSILEYVEHLAVGEDALVALVKRILDSPAQPETEEARREREKKVRETVIPRGANQAPERMKPAGRFASLQKALDAFLAARERTLDYARTTTEDLRSHFAPHPVLGPLDGYQWLAGNARHAETHAKHILEIREVLPALVRGTS
jgi:DinB superfamily